MSICSSVKQGSCYILQVLPIWEGTTNILSLDTLRAMHKTQGEAFKSYLREIDQRLTSSAIPKDLEASAAKVKQAANQIAGFVTGNTDSLQLAARELAYSLSRTYMGKRFLFLT